METFTPAEIAETYGDAHEPEFTLSQLTEITERLDKLTAAVNQFGMMLQGIVDNVGGMSQAIQKGGIGGILSLMKGASSE